MTPLWLLLGVAVAAVLLAWARRVGAQRVAGWQRLVRGAGDLRPGPALLEVCVAAEPGALVDLGVSRETGEGASATPTLETHSVRLVTTDGAELVVPAGLKLVVRGIAGARRRLLESVTTESGIEHRYSFELDGGRPFFVHAQIGPARDEAPFRAASARELGPVGGRILAGTRLVRKSPFGGGMLAGMAGGAFTGGMMVGLPASACIGGAPMSTVALWLAAYGSLLGAVAVEWLSLPDEPLEPGPEAVKVRKAA